MDCMDCHKSEHSSISCKCRCHWPSAKSVQEKINGIFKNVEFYNDDRVKREMQFYTTAEISSMSLVRFINVMFDVYRTFPVFHIDVCKMPDMEGTFVFRVRY